MSPRRSDIWYFLASLVSLLSMALPSAAAAEQGKFVVSPVVEKKLHELPRGPLYWRVENFPSLDDAQRERARIAALWLNELGDASSALIVIEDLIANQPDGDDDPPPPPARAMTGSIPPPPPPAIDVTDLLERVLAAAPKTAEVRESLPPPPDGRRDSYLPTAPKRGLVRQRAAALLKERYSEPASEANLARVLEVELEAVKSVKERIRRHQQIAAIYAQLGDDEHAMEHFVQLVLLEPEA